MLCITTVITLCCYLDVSTLHHAVYCRGDVTERSPLASTSIHPSISRYKNNHIAHCAVSNDNNVLWLVSVSAPVHCPLRVCVQDQLLINGRNHLALKNALAQQMQQQIIPGQVPAVVSTYTNYTVLL